MTYAEQLERETEQTRLQLADTLDELRASITPGQVVDQLVDYAQDGSGGEFFRNLKRQAAINPLPVTLVGAGLAWLMLSNGSGAGGRAARKAGETLDAASESASAAAARAGDTVTEGAQSATSALHETASEGRARIGEATRAAATSVKEVAASTYETASNAYGGTAAAVAGSASNLKRNSRSLAEFCRDQPLVLAGIGVALGAAIGALLPATDAEDRLMGGKSDKAKEKAQNVAASTYDRAVDVSADETARGRPEERGPHAIPDGQDSERQGEPMMAAPAEGEPSAKRGAREDGQGIG